ncbi:MAG: ferredoxin [Paracoccaceae bacterium]|nr:ferredoxin [Paracoccaceae bacterium]
MATFWPHFVHKTEYLDAAPDPLDRWSVQIIDDSATALNATAVFPVTGPLYPPFYHWALRSRCCQGSPLQMLVHHQDGLLLSLLGALAVSDHLGQPATNTSPCDNCLTKSCLLASPIFAFDATGYNAEMWQRHIRTRDSADHLTTGCAARHSYPASQRVQRSNVRKQPFILGPI